MLIMAAIITFLLAGLGLGHRHLRRRSPQWLSLRPLTHADLKKIPYFEKLGRDQLEKVEKLIREVRVPAGAFVLRENHVGDALYLVVSGKVNILKRGRHDQTLVQSVGPGEFIGEMALLCDVHRIASAQTETPSVLVHVDATDFPEFMSVSSEISDAVWAACDRHAIDLLLRDHERLRTLTVAERQAWIEARESEFLAGGETVKAARDGYLGVISGSAEIGGRSVKAPALLPCRAGEDFVVTSRGRLVFLGEPPRRKAA
jgi:CRP/FNR family cyclic AMP-dependent transcriptional regulator